MFVLIIKDFYFLIFVIVNLKCCAFTTLIKSLFDVENKRHKK